MRKLELRADPSKTYGCQNGEHKAKNNSKPNKNSHTAKSSMAFLSSMEASYPGAHMFSKMPLPQALASPMSSKLRSFPRCSLHHLSFLFSLRRGVLVTSSIPSLKLMNMVMIRKAKEMSPFLPMEDISAGGSIFLPYNLYVINILFLSLRKFAWDSCKITAKTNHLIY